MKMNPLKPLKMLKSLMSKSAKIQLHIEDETKKKNPDWFRIITLKKQRLLIKDKLNKLRRTKGMMIIG
jgi:hypothetical protein